MADDKKAPDAAAKSADTKTALFAPGFYMNTEPRVINLIPAKGTDGEMRSIVPGRNVELTDEDTTNKHIHHFVKHKFLVPVESAEAKAAREAAEAEQAKVDAAAAAKK